MAERGALSLGLNARSVHTAAADRGRYGNARNSILKAIFVALHKAELHYTLPRVAEAAQSERLGGPRGAGNRAWDNSPQQDAGGTGPTAQTMLAAQQASLLHHSCTLSFPGAHGPWGIIIACASPSLSSACMAKACTASSIVTWRSSRIWGAGARSSELLQRI